MLHALNNVGYLQLSSICKNLKKSKISIVSLFHFRRLVFTLINFDYQQWKLFFC